MQIAGVYIPIRWRSYEQERQAWLAEQAADELKYALDRMRADDLAALLEAARSARARRSFACTASNSRTNAR
jgi:hypothetical protein